MMKFISLILFASIFLIACQTQSHNTVTGHADEMSIKEVSVLIPEKIMPVVKTDEEWRKELTEEEYYVLREKGTERSFTGPYWDNKKDGIYLCRACDLPLFDAGTKYKSGTGWPSFYKPLKKEVVEEDVDYDIGYKRTEVLCGRCGGHLGHVFPDGPKPTGLRYCMNGTSLKFVPEVDRMNEVKK